ncbi:MAG TPA: DNA gyrase inhibitor YacG, partial [Candidatus Binatia bacterium]|nr:DNA gyrase inhibitor YacG [Candidatus Binatia bacterium]
MSRSVRCPTCRKENEWESNPHRPFCSERCRLIDLGAWVEERYRIPGDEINSNP